ncbi:hypothetical protein [Bifidobacterium panos]|uniref:hypothetical protein n=1 Tax=Bifidobacterium panos TaxID=2675321 RepID=UPI0015516FB2|nr:hypothetical protein [Bifidobacterium sp. DSM 109963]
MDFIQRKRQLWHHIPETTDTCPDCGMREVFATFGCESRKQKGRHVGIYRDLLFSFDFVEACREDPPGFAMLKLAESGFNKNYRSTAWWGK